MSRSRRSEQGPSTTAVHAGDVPDLRTGSVNTPIHATTTYLYPELADGTQAPYIYSRYDNPTVQAVESKLAALEGADASLLFASGLGAVHAACAALLRPKDRLVAQRGIYGGTAALFNDELAPGAGIQVTFGDAVAPPKVRAGTKLVWMESITNPLLRVADVASWAEAAHDANALLAVDATFATPMLQRPLDLGADVAMHSATKYLGGHSDLTAGALSCRKGLRQGFWQRRRNLGAILDPLPAYLLGRGMKTIAVRVERHCANALALAKACEDLSGVKAVHYPGLASHPDHATARRMLSGGFGGMLTLDLGTKAAAQRFRRKVQVITPASSLGGVESLVSLPRETSHAYASAADRKRDGITDGLVRISVGIEDIEDLTADVEQAVRAG